jgi:hypothetical protein
MRPVRLYVDRLQGGSRRTPRQVGLRMIPQLNAIVLKG